MAIFEIELDGEKEFFKKHPLAEREVTEDRRYYNENLLKNPFKSWA